MALQINKRLGRAVEYLEEDVNLFVPDNIGGWVLKAVVSRPEAHRWFNGLESFDDAPEPTVDEIIDTVADELKREISVLMDWALDNPEGLKGMYNAVRGGRTLVRAAW
jgi:hypothetical protein